MTVWMFFIGLIQDDGEIHREEMLIYTLVLPSLEPVFFFLFVFFFFYYMSGRFTSESLFVTLVLPFMNRKNDVFYGLVFWPLLWAFYLPHIFLWLPAVVWVTQWPRPCYMYIYSLGHFLTTKGALIDGDWGGSVFCQFWSKVTKNKWKNQ